MSWTIQPFQNTDLHNIYEAIISGGGGGGDTLAGMLLNGSVLPEGADTFGTYPYWTKNSFEFLGNINDYTSGANDSLENLKNLFNGVEIPSELQVPNTYPYWAKNTYDLINGTKAPEGFQSSQSLPLWLNQLAGCFVGWQAPDTINADTYPYWAKNFFDTWAGNLAFPNNTIGSFPYYLDQFGTLLNGIYNFSNNIETETNQILGYINGGAMPNATAADTYPYWAQGTYYSTQSTADSTSALFKLLTGDDEPNNYSGYYPDTLFKIKENTSATESAVRGLFKFGTTSARAITSAGADGYASSAAAAAAAAAFCNAQVGNFAAINITISHIAGTNGHSYAILYYSL